MTSTQKLSSFQRFFQNDLSIQKIKQTSFKILKGTVLKIQSLLKLIFPTLVFLTCSIYVLDFAAFRFFIAFGLTCFVKILSKKDKTILTTTNIALNIIGAIGTFLEKGFCPVCDPSFYLSAYLSGYATGASFSNLLCNYLIK